MDTACHQYTFRKKVCVSHPEKTPVRKVPTIKDPLTNSLRNLPNSMSPKNCLPKKVTENPRSGAIYIGCMSYYIMVVFM